MKRSKVICRFLLLITDNECIYSRSGSGCSRLIFYESYVVDWIVFQETCCFIYEWQNMASLAVFDETFEVMYKKIKRLL